MGRRSIVYVLAENIRSAYNVGSIFRTADGAGFNKVLLAGFSPTPRWESHRGKRPLHYSEKAATQIEKTALGAESSLNWNFSREVTPLINQLKKEGFTILALENNVPETQNLLEFVPKNNNLCLCVGNEVEGLSEQILSRADVYLDIPMRGEKESLNVAVAFGVAAYHLTNT